MPEPSRWGLENPHPLLGRKTELVWDGKYDEYGERSMVDFAGSTMPMQKIEPDESKTEALEFCSPFFIQLSLKLDESS